MWSGIHTIRSPKAESVEPHEPSMRLYLFLGGRRIVRNLRTKSVRIARWSCITAVCGVYGLAAASEDRVRWTNQLKTSGITYRNVSGESDKRYIVSSLGSGAAVFDYDQDGDLDVYFVNGARMEDGVVKGERNELYRNEGGWRFSNVTAQAEVGDRGWGMGCAVGDVDNDGFPDLYVTNLGPNVLYRNRGDGTFEDVTSRVGVGNEGFGTSAAFFDADSDGYLDLYVANYVEIDFQNLPQPGSGPACRWFGLPVFCGPHGLPGGRDVFYRSDSSGSFREASEASGLLDAPAAYGLGVVAGDVNNDGAPDLYVANDSVPAFLFINTGRGRFEEQGLVSGVAYNAEGRAQAGMGVDLGDVDGNGHPELFLTTFSHDSYTMFRNEGQGLFRDETTGARLRQPTWFYLGWATRMADLDNDSDLDLFVANGHVYPQVDTTDVDTSYHQRNQIFWNDGSGRFTEASFLPEDAMQEIAASRGAAFGDMDEDGDIDVVVVNLDGPPSLLSNELPPSHDYLLLRLVGTTSNRDSVGARVTLSSRNGARDQAREVHASGSYLSSSDLRLHFGLPGSDEVSELVVRWPGGREERLGPVPKGRVLTFVEGRSGTIGGTSTKPPSMRR